MIRKNTLLIVVAILFLSGKSQAQNYNYYWDKTYGGESRDWNSSVSTDLSGALFLIGDSQSDSSGDKTISVCNTPTENSDIWMLKIDIDGNVLWQKNFGGDADERVPKLFHLNNANKEMVMACYSTSGISCEKTEVNRDTVPLITPDYWICLLDSNGTIIWDKTFGGDNFDDYSQIAQLASSEFILAGESNSPVGYDKSVPNHTISNDLWALKVDGAGNKIWDRVYGGDGAEYLATVITEPDGSFVLLGSTNSDVSGDVSQPGQGNLDYWMIKVDNAGNTIWDKRFGGSGPDRCNYAAKTADNGYILCGFTVSPQDGDVSQAPRGIQDYWIVKTDSVGNKEWDKRFGGTDGCFGTYISVAPDGNGYWVGGYSNSTNLNDVSEPSYGGSDYWILKIDSAGTKMWDKRFGGFTDEFMTSMAFISDSVMMVFGHSDSGSSVMKTAPSKGWFDYWMVKFSYTDSTTSMQESSGLIAEINLHPNPTAEDCNVTFHLSHPADVDLEIRDIAGKLVLKNHLGKRDGFQAIAIDTSPLGAGTYFVNIWVDGNKSGQEKLVIIK